jgi:hypothetical protein
MDLNDRQREYLLALFHQDQEAERYYLHGWSVRRRGYPPPAREWRWIEYGPTGAPRLLTYDPPLRQALRRAGLVDPGAGSTWGALVNAGLVERRYEGKWAGQRLYHVVFVKLTRKGRALARQMKSRDGGRMTNDEQ